MKYALSPRLKDAGLVVGITMQASLTQSDESSESSDAPSDCGGREAPSAGCHRNLVSCDRALVGLVLWTLVHASEVLASDQYATTAPGSNRSFGGAPQAEQLSQLMNPIPDPFRLSAAAPVESAPAEFCPRRHSTLNGSMGAATESDLSFYDSSSLSQRLHDSRARDRFQLLTLWQTGGNSLSLQTGRRGDPTLQWTSRLMNRGAPRGLLDDVFSTTVAGASAHGLRFPARLSADAAKQPKTGDGGVPTIGSTK